MAFVSLNEVGRHARHIFENPQDFESDLLSIGIEHTDDEQ
jgi:hypothetical protein